MDGNAEIAALRAEVAHLKEQNYVLRSDKDFYRNRGITLLDAKWLDPRCHQGCQSLVIANQCRALSSELAEALAGVVRVADRRTVEFDAAHAALDAYHLSKA